MVVDSAVLLPSRGKEAHHQLCGYVEKQGTYVAGYLPLKPTIAVPPAGS